MSRLLCVSQSGFYAWTTHAESIRTRSGRALVVTIKAVHKASRNICGSPQAHLELMAQGHAIGRGRVARLMRDNALLGKRKRRFRTTTQSEHRHPITANVLEPEFTVQQPNTAGVGDITSIWAQARLVVSRRHPRPVFTPCYRLRDGQSN